MITSKFYKDYFALQNSLDTRISELETIHTKHLMCKNKCAECCMSFRILPIEFYAISHEIQTKSIEFAENIAPEKCKFLIQNSCSIYAFRPFICRTQGLPNVYFNEDQEAWDLSICELNFTNVPNEYFTEDNCLNMDAFNTELFELNQQFIEENPSLGYSPTDLIDINDLKIKD